MQSNERPFGKPKHLSPLEKLDRILDLFQVLHADAFENDAAGRSNGMTTIASYGMDLASELMGDVEAMEKRAGA